MQSLPYPNSLKFLLTPITCKSQKFKKKTQLPSFFSHTICDLTIHVCVWLSLSHALFHWGTQSQSFCLLSLKSYTSFDVQAIDQPQSKSSFCSHTNLREKRPLWEHVKPSVVFFLTLGGARFTKWNFRPKRLDGVLVFSLGISWSHPRFIWRSISLLALHCATSSVGWPGIMSGNSLGGSNFPPWGWVI